MAEAGISFSFDAEDFTGLAYAMLRKSLVDLREGIEKIDGISKEEFLEIIDGNIEFVDQEIAIAAVNKMLK